MHLLAVDGRAIDGLDGAHVLVLHVGSRHDAAKAVDDHVELDVVVLAGHADQIARGDELEHHVQVAAVDVWLAHDVSAFDAVDGRQVRHVDGVFANLLRVRAQRPLDDAALAVAVELERRKGERLLSRGAASMGVRVVEDTDHIVLLDDGIVRQRGALGELARAGHLDA